MFKDHEFEQSLGKPEYRPLYTYPDSSIYIGQWRVSTNIREGRGTFINAEGWMYEGYWYDDSAHNHGRNIYADGGVYTGAWVKSGRHGHGVHTYEDGRVYEGECANGFFEGTGVMRYPDGRR